MNIQKIGKLIAACRKEKGMTQAQLAEKLGVTNKTVSRWENGNYMPDLTILEPLSHELGISLEELLSGERIIAQQGNSDKTAMVLSNALDYSGSILKKSRTREVIAILVAFVTVTISVIIALITFSNKTLPAESGSEWMEADFALIKNNTVMMDCYSYFEDDNQGGDKKIVWQNIEYRQPLMIGDVVLVISVEGDKCETYYPWSDTPGVYGWVSVEDIDLDTMGNIDILWAKQARTKEGTLATLYSEPDYASEVIGDITGPVKLEAMGEGWFFAKEMVGGADMSGYIRQEDLIDLTKQNILVSTERKKHPGIRFDYPSEPVTTVKISNSSTFSEGEIYDALDIVEEFFNTEPSHSGCTLISLTYDDKWSQARSEKWKETYGKKDMIGIKVCFDTDETVVNTSGFAPNYRYEDFVFLVGREENKPWEVVTMYW